MKYKLYFLLAIFLLGSSLCTSAQIITTIAGGGSMGLGDGGPAIACELLHPYKVAVDGSGNLYIADRDHNSIRKVDPAGNIITIAGTGTAGYNGDNQPATSGQLHEPVYVVLDKDGNIYVSDIYNNRIRKINSSGIISTVAGNGIIGYNGDNIQATMAELNGPGAVTLDKGGNIYICDEFNNRIRKINTSGIISTVVGIGTLCFSGDGGPASSCELNKPYGLAFDVYGNLFVADWGNHRIRKINSAGIISTVAGNGSGGYSGDNGPATDAELNTTDIAVDRSGNMFMPDPGSNVLRKVDVSGTITTIAGTGVDGFTGDGGNPILAELNNPAGVTIDSFGNIYIADFGNERIRFITSTEIANIVNNVSESISLFPNPNNGNFTLSIKSGIEQLAKITIITIDGKKIKEFTALTNKPVNVELDERVGLYFLMVTTANSSMNMKLLITP